MMYDKTEFERRLEGIRIKHREMERGFVLRMDQSGLCEMVPRKLPWTRRHLGLRAGAGMIAALLLAKSAALAYVDRAEYDAAVLKLQQGGVAAQMGAWFLAHDPVSDYGAAQMLRLFP